MKKFRKNGAVVYLANNKRTVMNYELTVAQMRVHPLTRPTFENLKYKKVKYNS